MSGEAPPLSPCNCCESCGGVRRQRVDIGLPQHNLVAVAGRIGRRHVVAGDLHLLFRRLNLHPDVQRPVPARRQGQRLTAVRRKTLRRHRNRHRSIARGYGCAVGPGGPGRCRNLPTTLPVQHHCRARNHRAARVRHQPAHHRVRRTGELRVHRDCNRAGYSKKKKQRQKTTHRGEGRLWVVARL